MRRLIPIVLAPALFIGAIVATSTASSPSPAKSNDAGLTDATTDVLADATSESPPPIPPDPTPLACESIFILSLKWEKGTITLEKAKREKLANKQALPRLMGRFAVELFSGPTLIERIRFDFPLLTDDGVTPDIYGKGLVATIDVKVPESDRPNKMEIWDRLSNKRWKLDYPPKLTP